MRAGKTFYAAAFALAAFALQVAICIDHKAVAATMLDGATDPQTSPERLRRNRVSPLPNLGDADFRNAQQQGLDGNRDAALRVAQMIKAGSNGVPRDEDRMLQWLLHASALGNGAASYQLYLHYVDQRLDRNAVFFENRAIAQGYATPPRLDTRR